MTVHGNDRRAQKGGLSQSLQAEVSREVEALIAPQAAAGLDFEAIETAARRQVLGLAARAIEQRFNSDLSDGVESARPCRRGGMARYVDRRGKDFETALGPLRLERAYYHCAECNEGFSPRDRVLCLERSSVSPAVARMTARVGSLLSFEEGSALLWELAGVRLGSKQVERLSEALGEEVAEDERLHAESLPLTPIPETLYLGMDGTGIPMRASELLGRTGKQPDGSAKTREAKLCAVWSAESRDAEGRPVRDEGSVSYSAAIESAAAPDTQAAASAFAERALREAQRRGFDKARRRVVLGDGAAWIWKLAELHFPDAIQIVDRFHAKEHLSAVAKQIYGADTPLAKAWAKRRHTELDQGRIDALLDALKRQARRSTEAAKCIGYVLANRERMRYPEFHARALCTSTAVVEAGCKLAVWTRFKRTGMHWTVRGANAILALRCSLLSARFEDFWARRA